MSKNGNHSQRSGRHGREGWLTWLLDQLHNKQKSTIVRKWMAVLVEQIMDAQGLLLSPEKFRSSIAALRPHPADSWGYRFVSRTVGELPPARNRSKNKGNQTPSEKHDRRVKPGEPEIDLGYLGLVGVPMGDISLPTNKLDEKFDPYSILLDDAGRMLREYDYVHPRTIKAKKKKGKDGKIVTIPEHIIWRTESRKPKGIGAEDNLKRMTVDLIPALSRAVELMIEAGLVKEARKILDGLLPVLAKELEEIFPGAKVVACGWHVLSGQLHADFWVHCTKLEIHHLGEKQSPTLCRTWDPDGLAHQGPGPGVCAWDRHMAALGEEMETLAPATCREVRQAIAHQEERAILRGRPGVANRDIAIHRRFDEVVGASLPEEFVSKGMEAYRHHLRQVYAGGDPKIEAVMSDPKREKKYRKQVAEGLKAARRLARDAAKAREDALALYAVIEIERNGLQAKDTTLAAKESALELREISFSSREQVVAQNEKDLVGKNAELDQRQNKLNERIGSLNKTTSDLRTREQSVRNAEQQIVDRLASADSRETAVASLEKSLNGKVTRFEARVSRFRNWVKKRRGNLRELRVLRQLGRRVEKLIPHLPSELPATDLGEKLAGIRDWMANQFAQRRKRKLIRPENQRQQENPPDGF